MSSTLRIFAFSLIAIFASNSVVSDVITLAPAASYKDIDVGSETKLAKRLSAKSNRKRKKALAVFLNDPSSHNPSVIYAASHALFEAKEKEEAAFWFYAAQVRARYDANRCLDKSARQAVAILNQTYGGPINQYAFQDLDGLKMTVKRAVEWDRITPHNYDHRWINLHGMASILATMKSEEGVLMFSKPEREWDEIAETTRAEYLEQFEQAVAQMSPIDSTK